MSTEIKNTLFRFVTMRAPENVTGTKKQQHFVYHPDKKLDGLANLSTSFFKTALNEPKNSTSEQFTTLLSRATQYESEVDFIHTTNDIEGIIGTEYLNFSNDFSKIRTASLKSNKVEDMLENDPPVVLSSATLVKLWDNLFYQILKQTNPALRNQIMEVIIADHYSRQDLSKPKDTLKASIVIPKVFLGDSETIGYYKPRGPRKSAKTVKAAVDKLLDADTADTAKDTVSKVLKARKELEAFERKYRKSEAKNLSTAQDTHKEAVDLAYSTATLVFTEVTNAVTGEVTTKRTYTDLVLPEFTYFPNPEIDTTDLLSSIGETACRVLDMEKVVDCQTFADVYQLMDQTLTETNEQINQRSASSNKTAVIAGVPLPVNEALLSRTGDQFVYTKSMKRSRFSMSTEIPPIDPDIINSGTTDPFFYWSDIKISMENLDLTDINTQFSTYSIEYYDVIEEETKTVNLNLNSVIGTGSIIIKGLSAFTLDLPAETENVTFNAKLILADGTIEFSSIISLHPDLNSYLGIMKSASGVAYFKPFNESTNPDPSPEILPGEGEGDNGINEPVSLTIPDSETFVPSKFGIKSLGIADYRRVEQEVCCYEPGEVSHIENIMAREYKEKSTERSRITDTTTTVSSERESENLTDTSSTSRNEMHSEVSQVLHEDMQVGLQSEFHWGGKVGGSIGASFAMGSSQDDSTLQAVTYAQDVTERAMERIVSKLKNEKITKVIESYKENNKHGFDNTKGTQHVSGVYRWINKVYNNQLVNYGKRALVEFMIPEPARFHILASIKNTEEESALTVEKPIDPRSEEAGINKIENFKDIAKIANLNNYVYWSSRYSIEAEIAPSEYLSAGKSFTKSENAGEYADVNKAMSADIDVPEGYYLERASTSGTVWGQTCMLYIANKQVNYYTSAPVTFSEKFTSKIPVSIYFDWVVGATVNVNLTFKRSDELYQSWQNRIFNDIIEAYEEKLEAYNQAVLDAKTKAEETVASNPLFYRQIERNALKKNIMHYLVDENYIGRDYIESDEDLMAVRPNNNVEFDANASVSRFMEQAFEWDIMSYNFLPFYWGAKNRWKEAYNYDFNDALFTNFMQAGMARVIVTVRPGFEKAVNWYMATGQAWNGGQVPTLDDDLFLSIDEELRDVQPVAEGLPWKTKLPSDLTVIQNGTIALNASGLPCGCPTEVGGDVHLENTIDPTNALLTNGETEIEGISASIDGILQEIVEIKADVKAIEITLSEEEE